MSPPQIVHAATAVTMPVNADARSSASTLKVTNLVARTYPEMIPMVVSSLQLHLRSKGGLTLDCIARSKGVGMMPRWTT